MNIESLLEKMTIREKIGQLIQLPPTEFTENGQLTGPNSKTNSDAKYMAGSILGLKDVETVKKIQEEYLENSRLKIPLFFANDVIHGYNTNFPIPLALASTFNPKIVKDVCKVAAQEAFYAGVHVNYSPMLDLCRDARWGRVMEGNGEDPFLNKILGVAYVEGYQGNGIENKETVACCLKHFIGYGAGESGRDYNQADISKRNIMQSHIPAFEASINAGAEMIMTSFNTIDNIPSTCNKYLLQDVLRSKLNFNKIIISDWNGIGELFSHRLVKDESEAAFKCFQAGLDIEMCTQTYFSNLENLIKDGKCSEKDLDKSVKRVLELKKSLGLFSNPYRGLDSIKGNEIKVFNQDTEILKIASQKSIVLLKNKNILPLNLEKMLAIVGPNANETRLNGSWACCPNEKNSVSLNQFMTDNHNTVNIKSIHDSTSFIDVDYIIYAGGEKETLTGEGRSVTSIEIYNEQVEEIRKLQELNIPIIYLNYSGRPLALTKIENLVDAIVQVWFLGPLMSEVISETLFGISAPTGKLPMCFPRSTGQCPIYYSELSTGRYIESKSIPYASTYINEVKTPLYPFGHGLTYGKYRIDNIIAEINKSKVQVKISVQNDSDYHIQETLQVYIQDKVSQVARPVKELVAIEKIEIEGLKKSDYLIEFNKKELGYFLDENNFIIEEGEFIVFVGFNSRDTIETIIDLKN